MLKSSKLIKNDYIYIIILINPPENYDYIKLEG